MPKSWSASPVRFLRPAAILKIASGKTGYRHCYPNCCATVIRAYWMPRLNSFKKIIQAPVAYWLNWPKRKANHLRLNMIAAPILVWTRYSIPSGALKPDLTQTLRSHLQAYVLAQNTQVAVAPCLYSID